MKDTMKAFALWGKPSIGYVPDEIKEISIPIPVLGKDEILIKIIASTMHIDDIALAQGTALGRFLGPKHVSPDNPYVMGSSFSGIITDKGINVTEHEVGDEVIGIPKATGKHGAWAEYRAVHKKYIRPKPKEISGPWRFGRYRKYGRSDVEGQGR